MSLFKDGAPHTTPEKKSGRPGWSAIDVAGYRIDVIHPERHAVVGWNPSLLKIASLGIGYLLVLFAVTRAMALYLGWGPTLLLFGAAHLGFAFVGLPHDAEAVAGDELAAGAPMGMPGWHLLPHEEAVSQTGERAGTLTPRPPVVRPPTFPPRTRTVT